MFVYLLIVLIAAIAGLLLFSWFQNRRVERLYPPSGEFVDVGGYRLHCRHIPAPANADLPAIVFLHGASGNLLDQTLAFQKSLHGRAEMLFVDRPGHGWSERGPVENGFPDGQARAVAELMTRRNIDKALIVGHSFGGIIAANMALERPERVAGLLFLASASHPWPGGIDWHYRVASNRLIGKIFSWLLVMPIGLARIDRVAHSVFSPNAFPPNYVQDTAAALVLRPDRFCNNAVDVANLYPHVVAVSPRYSEITHPTVVMTGDTDTIVSPDIHSASLAKAIKGSTLLRLKGVGHKPDFAANELCLAALEHLSGKPVDLLARARQLEKALQQTGDVETTAGPQQETASAGQMPVMPSDPI